jgi:uncharacterized protein YukE
VADAEAFSGKMGELQKLRVTLVILLSQENSKLLGRRQRVAGKEIEVMTAERDLAESDGGEAAQKALDQLYAEDTALRLALSETEQEIRQMEALMIKVDADIAALCQS